jgi:hypothetical protein
VDTVLRGVLLRFLRSFTVCSEATQGTQGPGHGGCNACAARLDICMHKLTFISARIPHRPTASGNTRSHFLRTHSRSLEREAAGHLDERLKLARNLQVRRVPVRVYVLRVCVNPSRANDCEVFN